MNLTPDQIYWISLIAIVAASVLFGAILARPIHYVRGYRDGVNEAGKIWREAIDAGDDDTDWCSVLDDDDDESQIPNPKSQIDGGTS